VIEENVTRVFHRLWSSDRRKCHSRFPSLMK